MRPAGLALLLWVAAMAPIPGPAAAAPPVRVGSKSFTESYILAELAAQAIERAGEAEVVRHLGLGGTGIAFRALEHGDVDVYPEYTGTLSRMILKDPGLTTIAALRRRLEASGLVISEPLGFDNTYALAVRRDMATRRGLRTLSDLARHRDLRGAFSSGFVDREDGWPGLSRHYGLALADTRVMEHALTYQALVTGTVDVIDVFSTDGQLARLDLALLEDDRAFFPGYAAVLLARRAFVERFPKSWAELQRRLVGHLDAPTMRRLNARAEEAGHSFERIAAEFLGPGPASAGDRSASAPPARARRTVLSELPGLTLDHLGLVAVALGAAVLIGVPLGILAARLPGLGQMELMSIGVLQTIPALALLCFMIPLFGIGRVPSLVALALYALLPIVRNTYTALAGLDRQLLDMAGVLGLTSLQRLARVELPLASMGIMAGIKTSAVLTVGTATLAAFIGGGGYGALIVRGLALDDVGTILAGAAPAAAMALVIHGAFELLDRVVIPRGLRRSLAPPG
jgi:osmoprotectant transport system permease protein